MNKLILKSISHMILNFILVCNVYAKTDTKGLDELIAFQLQDSPVLKLLNNKVFEKPADSLDYNPSINANFEMVAIQSTTYFKILKDNYKANKNNQYQLSQLPEININLQQNGQSIYPSTTAFKQNSHPNWEWQISKGEIWQEPLPSNLLKIILPFALQERNANCTHTGYIYLFKVLSNPQSNPDEPWQGYYQISAETCAYLQFDMAGQLKINSKNIKEKVTFKQSNSNSKTEITYNTDVLSQDYPKLKIKNLMPKDSSTNTVSGLVINNKHYRLNCENRAGLDPYCDQLVLPSYSTAKSLFAGIALMRLEKLFPTISKVSVSEIIPECDKKQWQDVSLADLLNMRTGNYLSKQSHVDESSSRMLEFFLATTDDKKLKLACNSFKHRSKAGKYFVYHTSDTYLAGVIMNKLYQQFTKQADIYQDLMIDDLWKNLNLSDLFMNSKRTYDDTQQTFTGFGLSYYISDLIKIVNFIHQQSHDPTLLDKTQLHSAMQIGEKRINRPAGEVNTAYNFGFWGLEVGHTLKCKKPKWIPFMSGFGGISIIMYSPDIFYYSFADDHQYDWLSVVKELNKQFPLCED